MSKTVKIVIAALLGLFLVGLSFWAGFGISRMLLPTTREAELMREVYSLLRSYYVNPEAITPELLEKGSVAEMLAALNDQYTYHISAKTWAHMQSYFQGSYVGIGVVVEIQEGGRLVVIDVIPDSPAEGKIEPGDWIQEIDGQSTSGMSLDEAGSKMRGEEGTAVTLTIWRQSQTMEFTLIREEITLATVDWELIDGTLYDIAYIEISYFSELTDDELISLLEDEILVVEELDGIILDLRENPGGILWEQDYSGGAVGVAAQFLEEGTIILWLDDGRGNEEAILADSGGLATDLPLAVLVDGGTASAAEMVAGAFQDDERALLIGTETYGKGSMQYIIPLSDGSAVSITCAYWYTPSRYPSLHLTPGNGLTPDLEVEGETAQLEAAIDYITGLE